MSRSARIANYIERQFLTEEGAVRDNAEALFAADVAYHTAGETLTLEDIIVAAIAVCRSPRARRRIEATAFREQGDTVSWHISATLPGMADDGSDVAQRSFVRAAFDADDMISEVWSVDSGTT